MRAWAMVAALVAAFAITAQAQSRVPIPAGEWAPLSAQLAKVYNNLNRYEEPRSDYPAIPSSTATLKSSGVQVALFDLGTLGASTSAITVAVMQHGQPMLAKFRDQRGMFVDDGQLFPQGASVMHEDSVEIDAVHDAIVTKSFALSGDAKRLGRCDISAFRWNATARSFDWDRKLSAALRGPLCDSERKHPTLPPSTM